MEDIKEILIVNGLPRDTTLSAVRHCFCQGNSARAPTEKMFRAMGIALGDKGKLKLESTYKTMRELSLRSARIKSITDTTSDPAGAATITPPTMIQPPLRLSPESAGVSTPKVKVTYSHALLSHLTLMVLSEGLGTDLDEGDEDDPFEASIEDELYRIKNIDNGAKVMNLSPNFSTKDVAELVKKRFKNL